MGWWENEESGVGLKLVEKKKTRSDCRNKKRTDGGWRVRYGGIRVVPGARCQVPGGL